MMFSVIIPLYNKRSFIGTTLDSVLCQDLQQFEVIIVDDGSTDGSLDVVAARSDPRLRVIRQGNHGVGAARNAGVRASGGKWVAFIDADDLWAPDHLSVLKSITEAVPEAGFISTRSTRIANDQGIESLVEKDRGDMGIEAVQFFCWVLKEPGFFVTCSIAVRRELLEEVGGFGHFQPGQDVDLWVRLAFVTKSAIARVTTNGIRKDEHGITARGVVHKPTKDLRPKEFPTPVLTRLDEYLRNEGAGADRRCVERYVDHRLLIGIRVALCLGERARVWRLWRLMRVRFGLFGLLHLAAVLAPTRLLQAVCRKRVGRTVG